MATRKKSQGIVQFNVFGMSNIAVSFTNSQNELARCKLAKELERLEWEERLSKTNKGKETDSLKNDIVKRKAVCHVYRAHSFCKYDPYGRHSEGFETHLKKNNSFDVDSEMEEDDNTLPVVRKKRMERSMTNLIETVSKANEQSFDRHSAIRQSLPNISMPEFNYKNVKSQNVKDTQEEETNTYILPKLPTVALWKQNKELAKTAEEFKTRDYDRERYRAKKEAPRVKPEFKAMFPGNCRTATSMRKFVDREAENMIQQKDSILYSKKTSALQNLIKNAKVPEFIKRSKTTSAIYRDYNTFKREKSIAEPERIDED